MLGLIGGLFRAADGKDFIPMPVFVGVAGALIALVTQAASSMPWYLHYPFCMAGVLAWKAAKWGLYFAAFHGMWNRLQHGVKWIDWIGYKLVPFEAFNHFESNRKRGLICMAIRGAVYSLPLFTYLGISVHWSGFLLWVFMAMQGVIYWAAFWVTDARENGIRITASEIVTVWFMIDLAAACGILGLIAKYNAGIVG